MANWTRRRVLGAVCVGPLGALAGCSSLSEPEQTVLLSVNNYTETRYEGTVLLENDRTTVVRQYLEVPPAEPDGWATVETELTLGAMASGTPLDVTASFGEMTATGEHDLDCANGYRGDVVYVQIEPDVEGPNLRLNLACYDEFPSSEAGQGGLARS